MPAKRIAAMELGVPAAPTGTHKLIGAIAPQFAARQRGVWTTGDQATSDIALKKPSGSAYIEFHGLYTLYAMYRHVPPRNCPSCRFAAACCPPCC
jgi:hypothetical protein